MARRQRRSCQHISMMGAAGGRLGPIQPFPAITAWAARTIACLHHLTLSLPLQPRRTRAIDALSLFLAHWLPAQRRSAQKQHFIVRRQIRLHAWTTVSHRHPLHAVLHARPAWYPPPWGACFLSLAVCPTVPLCLFSHRPPISEAFLHAVTYSLPTPSSQWCCRLGAVSLTQAQTGQA